LSRELSLDEIAEIKQRCPEMEIEVFVHGALCIAYSGRCLLSGYFNHRDPNQGTCTNSCRWDYKVENATENETGDLARIPVETIKLNFNEALEEANQSFSAMGDMPRHPLADRPYLIEESGRPGSFMPILEDEHGTYIMNSKDLRAIEHVARLAKIGVDSLKVEGRTKSLYYVSRTAQAYRHAIDDAVAGRPFNEQLLGQLDGLANRGYTDGFYQRHHTQDHQNYMEGVSKAHRSQYVAQVLNVVDGWAEVEVKNRFAVGDQIEIIHPSGNEIITLAEMRNQHNAPISIIGGAGHKVRIPLDAKYDKALLARML
jgi:putative protease